MIFFFSTLSYMKRFFLIVDEIPYERQRKLPASQGGRFHPLARRTFCEYRHAFDYAYYIMSRGRVNRAAEIRYLQKYKNKLKDLKMKKGLKTMIYKRKMNTKAINNDLTVPLLNNSLDDDTMSSQSRRSSSSGKITHYLTKVSSSLKDKVKRRKMQQLYANTKMNQTEIFEKYQDCTICLDSFKNGDRVKIMPQCCHIFHEKCCSEWLDYKFRCPNCNIQIEFDKVPEEPQQPAQNVNI